MDAIKTAISGYLNNDFLLTYGVDILVCSLVLVMFYWLMKLFFQNQKTSDSDRVDISIHSDLSAIYSVLETVRSQMDELQAQQKKLQQLEHAVGRRMDEIEDGLCELNKNTKPAQDTMQTGQYASAIKLIQQGGSLNDVMKRCHISLDEAEMLMAVHQ